METWERLQARLDHLGYLGEELPRVVATPGVSAWLYRQIAAEAGEVARIAGAYVAECDHSGHTTRTRTRTRTSSGPSLPARLRGPDGGPGGRTG